MKICRKIQSLYISERYTFPFFILFAAVNTSILIFQFRSNHIDRLLQLKDLASPVYFFFFAKAKRFNTAFSSRSLV